MENKDVQFGYIDSVNPPGPAPIVASSARASDANLLSLDPKSMPYDEPVPSGEWTKVQSKNKLGAANIVVLSVITFLLIAGVTAVILRGSRSSVQTNITGRYGTVEVPLENLSVDESTVSFSASKVAVNGSLQLNQGLVVTPSAQPTDAKAGQLYFDQTTNQLAYFNGTQFVAISGSGTPLQPSITIIQGAGTPAATGITKITSANASIAVADDGNGNVTLTGNGLGAFLQGGNSFGATAVMGTNDNFGLDFKTNNVVTFGLSSSGAATFKNATDSANAFRVQDAAANTVLNVNTTNGVTTTGGPLMVSNSGQSLFTLQNDSDDSTFKISSTIIGNPSKDGGQDRNTAYIQASKFNSGPGGTLDSLYVYFTIVDNANPNFKVAIYDDLASTPNNRVSSATAPATPATVNTWNKASLGGTVTLAPNTDYWLAFTTESGNTWYARQNTGSNTTKYMGGFPWGTDFPGTYNVTDINDVFTAVYGTYISTTDNSGLAGTGIHMSNNNELIFRPVFDSSTTLQVTNRLASRLLLGVNSLDGYVSAASLQIGGVDLDSAFFVRSGSPNGAITAWRDSSTGTDTILRLLSNEGGAGTLKFNFRSNGSVVMTGGQTADITTANAATATALALQPGATTGADGTGAVLSLKAGDETSNSCVTACEGGDVAIQGGSATGSSGNRNGGSVSIEAGLGATANGSIDIGAASVSHAINIGTGAAAKTIIIGNGTGTTSLILNSGTNGTSLTSSGNIVIGTIDSTGTLFVLDTKDSAGDPSYLDGAMYYNSATRSFRCGQGTIWVSCGGGLLSSNTAPSTAIANTAAETDFSLNYSLPANYCVQGRVIRWTAQGVYSTTGSPNLTLRFKAGTTALATSPNFTAGTNVTNQAWTMEGRTICNAAPGAAAATETQGNSQLFTTDTAFNPGVLKNTTTTNLATNGALTLQISAQWGTADPSNTITLRQFVIEGIGP